MATRQQQKNVEAAVEKGAAKKVKKTLTERIAGAFTKEDLTTVAENTILPGLQDVAYSTFNTILNLIIYQDARGRRGRPSQGRGGVTGSSIIDYSARYLSRGGDVKVNDRKPLSSVYDDVWVRTPEEAQDIIDRLFDTIEGQNYVSVANLYQAAHMTPVQTDFNYGWYDISSAHIMPRDGGFVIKMARPEALTR